MPKVSGSMSYRGPNGVNEPDISVSISNMDLMGSTDYIDIFGNGLGSEILFGISVHSFQLGFDIVRGLWYGWTNNIHFSHVRVEGIDWITESFRHWASPSVATLFEKWAQFSLYEQEDEERLTAVDLYNNQEEPTVFLDGLFESPLHPSSGGFLTGMDMSDIEELMFEEDIPLN